MAGALRRYNDPCLTPSIHRLAEAAHRRRQLGPVALHKMSVAAIGIRHELDAAGRGLRSQIGHVDWHGSGQVDLFLNFGVLALWGWAFEKEAREALVILDPDAAVADPQLILREMLFLRRIMEIDAEVIGKHELHHSHRVRRTG